MEGETIDGLDAVSRAQAGLVGWSSRLDLLDADGAGGELRQHTSQSSSIIGLQFTGDMKGELQGLAAALHRDRDRLVGVQVKTIEDFNPVRIVGIGKVADDVAGLNARLGRGRAGDDPLDGRIFDFTFPGNMTSAPITLPDSGPYLIVVANTLTNGDAWTITLS